jgi:hypothetical protein
MTEPFVLSSSWLAGLGLGLGLRLGFGLGLGLKWAELGWAELTGVQTGWQKGRWDEEMDKVLDRQNI